MQHERELAKLALRLMKAKAVIESEGDLGPMRRVHNRGKRKPIGRYPSYKIRRALTWESVCERELMWQSESDPDVTAYYDQPHKVTIRLPEMDGNTVLVRFKKADRSGAGQNIKTGANDRFLNPRLPFPDAPEAMKVEICWKLNALRTGYDSLHVTSRNGTGVLWSYEMPGGVQETIRFPTKPAEAPAAGRRRAKLKSEDAKKKSRDAS